MIEVQVYRYDPDKDAKPYMQSYQVDDTKHRVVMVLDLILAIKDHIDNTLSVRRSCREGVCGSDGMNINGKNGLACITAVSDLTQPIILRPLPGLPVIRDLIVDMTQFYKNYESVDPYLINDEQTSTEYLQSPKERALLDGLYECILCACCSTSCPSFWWQPELFLGPAALLQALRFVLDSRDNATRERLAKLSSVSGRVNRCHSIGNCAAACPKGLNPTRAIGKLRGKMMEAQT